MSDQEEIDANTGSTSVGGKRKRGQRGPTLAPSIARLSASEKIPVIVNEYNQSCERHSSTKLATWIGVQARNNQKFPVKYKDWRKLPKQSKDDGWIEIKSKFGIEEKSKGVVLSRLNERWREYKHTLKKNHYDMYDSAEERMANIDLEQLPKEDWETLFALWDNEEFKAVSARNKIHKAKQKIRHTTGNTSLAVIRAEMANKDPNGLPPSRIEMFEATYVSKKTGQCLNDEAAQILITLKEKIGEKTVEEQADKTVHESVFKEVLGSDSHGRVRLYGSGVSSKQVFGTKAKQIEEQNVKIQEQNDKIKKLEESMQAQEEFNRLQTEYMKKMDAMLQSLTSQLHESQMPSQSSCETQPPSETQ